MDVRSFVTPISVLVQQGKGAGGNSALSWWGLEVVGTSTEPMAAHACVLLKLDQPQASWHWLCPLLTLQFGHWVLASEMSFVLAI